MTSDREVQFALPSDSPPPWQRAISDGLLEAQTKLAQMPPDQAEPAQQDWQIVGQAFESGMRALQAMRG